MSLKKLPKIKTEKFPQICAFEQHQEAIEKWNLDLKASESEDNTISILDTIGEDWFGEGVTAKRISAALRSIGDKDVVVNINSGGGDFFEGVAIYNLLRSHPAKVTVRVLGLAASAASVIAMAGDEIQVAQNGFLMIHNSWVVAVGNRFDLIEAASTMEPFDQSMAELYADRAGVDPEVAAQWMADETWFSGQKAVDDGLADSLLPKDSVVQDVNSSTETEYNALRRLDNILAKSEMPRTERRLLLSKVKGATQDAGPTTTQDAGDIEGLLKGLVSTLS